MKKFKIVLLLAGMLAMLSCSNKTSLIDEFHTAIDTSTTETILDAYFVFPDTITKNSLTSAYTNLFDAAKSYKALGPYEVLTYQDARSKWANIPLVTDGIKQSKVYVVKYANDELLYIRFTSNKIQSMLPVLKGDAIGGWL